MTKSQCYNEIARNNQLIGQYQWQISELNREIGELTEAKWKVENMKTTLSSCKQSSMEKLSVTENVNRINTKIVNKIYNNMTDLFSGEEYISVFNGLGSGITTIQEEIARKQNQIGTLNGQIAGCQETIRQMNIKIANIEAAERAAREAAENATDD